MRLVIEHSCTDGYTYSCNVTTPVEYESAEDFAVDFEAFCKSTIDAMGSPLTSLTFANQAWDPTDFILDGQYYGPNILTVDEWFTRN